MSMQKNLGLLRAIPWPQLHLDQSMFQFLGLRSLDPILSEFARSSTVCSSEGLSLHRSLRFSSIEFILPVDERNSSQQSRTFLRHTVCERGSYSIWSFSRTKRSANQTAYIINNCVIPVFIIPNSTNNARQCNLCRNKRKLRHFFFRIL